MTVFQKDPEAVLDYAWDWSAWLATSETISTFTVTATTGLTVATSPAPAQTAGIVTAWLTGGTAVTVYDVICHIVTNQGRTDNRTIKVHVMQR